ncbi:MAG TPA: AAA family ATPase, partial [Nitrospiraceae bacterium]|nr:AAA family ATPase [Nitrospiraceae bacterium]
ARGAERSMYEAFFGFQRQPFTLLPDPEHLYLGTQHKTALSLLEYGILRRAGFIVITGEPGTGKTTLLHRILAELSKDCTIGLISNTNNVSGSIMPWILKAFGLSERGNHPIEMLDKFSSLVARECANGRRVVLILDEAQSLGENSLEELRQLSNVNVGKDLFLQVILFGQQALRDLLRQPGLVQFAQRVAVDYNLGPMEERETADYIRHRIGMAGGAGTLFTDPACALVHQFTGGVPRLINQVCDTTLVYGFAEQARRLTARLVAEASRDRALGGILPLAQKVDATPFIAEDDKGEGVSEEPRAPQVIAPQTLGTKQVPRDQSEAYFQEGIALKSRGRYREAVQLLEAAAQDSAYWFEAFSQAGMCYREWGHLNKAIVAFRKALADQSASSQKTSSVLYELGRTLETLRKDAEALDCYRRVELASPDFRDVVHRIQRLPRNEANATATAADKGLWTGRAWQRLKLWVRDRMSWRVRRVKQEGNTLASPRQ